MLLNLNQMSQAVKIRMIPSTMVNNASKAPGIQLENLASVLRAVTVMRFKRVQQMALSVT